MNVIRRIWNRLSNSGDSADDYTSSGKPAMETLGSILRRADRGLEEGWLYLSGDGPTTLETLGLIVDFSRLEEDDFDEDEEPAIAKEMALTCTLDLETIEEVVSSAGCIGAKTTDALLLEAFLYYCEYDAFLPEPGYELPPLEETQLSMDRDFYDLLGDEDPAAPCKRESCNRGSTKFSVFCKVHHFEMIKKKPCPFSH